MYHGVENISVASSDPSKQRKAHETVSKRFDGASNGKIHTKNFNEIFAMMLICLKLSLEHEDHQGNSLFRLFKVKICPYSFTVEDAVSQMKDLELKVNLRTTCTTFSYSMKPELALSMLRKFMRAKWLHCPTDRTRLQPKSGLLLQPTPKGCAILLNFCLKVGLGGSELPSILSSNFNSMELVRFERDSKTDHIIHSEYFIHLLFVRFMGPEPNVWRSTNDPDPIPSSTLMKEDIDFIGQFESPKFDEWDPTVQKDLPEITKDGTKEESPFHHRFFTNPESDSHVQYYVSNKGVRLFKSRDFGDPPFKVNYCFSGKSAVQWFMDCTDTLYNLEAAEIVNLFIKYGLVKPITLTPSRSPMTGFKRANDCFYTLSSKGLGISQWNRTNTDILTQSDGTMAATSAYMIIRENFTLKDVLEDAGSRFLFRQHLETDLCLENLDAYCEIAEFFKLMNLLKKLLKIKMNQKEVEVDITESSSMETATYNKEVNTKDRALMKLTNECLAKSYSIYSSFLSNGSPYMINISDDWREEVQSILVHPTSPFRESFPITEDSETAYSNDDGHALFGPNQKRDPRNKEDDVSAFELLGNEVLISSKQLSEPLLAALKILSKIDPLLKQISQHIYFLLSQDSFPKFIKSDIFQKNSSQVQPTGSQSE